MTIAEAREKCKGFMTRIPRDVLIIAVLILASLASFGLGYLAAPMPEVACALSQPVGAGNTEALNGEATSAHSTSSGQAVGKYVASKNGTKYYLTSCAGANKISDANKVWFASAIEAKAAGYTPAAV
ncbi:MAG: hypothetical protein NTU85_02855 [Candidatus Kaiserbacteria bacterium]|nr:hypothetical protein [Candidatus Kaiserbacteria bacterium]